MVSEREAELTNWDPAALEPGPEPSGMLRINRIRDQRGTVMWKADRRLYLSEDGRVVDEGAPGRKTLLAAQGSEVPGVTCRRYGLGPFALMEAEADPTELETTGDTGETPAPSETEPHRHRWKKDNTCRCGVSRE